MFKNLPQKTKVISGLFGGVLVLLIGVGIWAGLAGKININAATTGYKIFGDYYQPSVCGSSNSPTAYPSGSYNPYRGIITYVARTGYISYEIPNVPNGTYKVVVGGASCGTSQIEDRTYSGKCSSPSTTVTVNNASVKAPDMSSYDCYGVAWIKVSHMVPRLPYQDPGTGPAPNAEVKIMSGPKVVARGYTNSHGNAGFSNIPYGSYRVLVTFKGETKSADSSLTINNCEVVTKPQLYVHFDDL